MEDPFYSHALHSRAYLQRGMDLLRRFDEQGDVAAFYYAALELRFGIEARVWEYLDPVLKQRKVAKADVNEYVASHLLKRLQTLDPQADQEAMLRIFPTGGGRGTQLRYTPVTPELAKLHGRLGELLHFNLYTKNDYILFRKELAVPGKTLVKLRAILAEAVEGLREATSGTLTSHPHFERIATEVLDEDQGHSADGEEPR